MSKLIPSMVKPVVDITWFTAQLARLTGARGMAVLYSYALIGLVMLRLVTPDFGALAKKVQPWEACCISPSNTIIMTADNHCLATFRVMLNCRWSCDSLILQGIGLLQTHCVESFSRHSRIQSSIALSSCWALINHTSWKRWLSPLWYSCRSTSWRVLSEICTPG